MNISVENVSGLERKMQIAVPEAVVKQALTKRFGELNKQVRLKGFRPGKVPGHVLEQRYGDQVRQEVQEDFLRKAYAEGLKEHALKPVAQPEVDAPSWIEGQDMRFTMTFEIYPDVTLAKLDGLTVEQPKVEIAEDDINEVLTRLQKQHAHFHAVERKAELGDQVEITFSGELKKEKVEGAQGEKVKILLGEGQMLEDFEKKIVGLKPGANKKFKVKMPKDYYQNELAGETLKYELELHSVGAPHYPELNDEFAKKLDIEDMAALREEIKNNMARELEVTIDNKVREQLVDQWVSENPIDMPKSLVQKEVTHRQEASARQMGIEDQSQWPKPDLFEAQAQRAVHFGLLLQALIEQEQMTPQQDKMEARMRDIAARYSSPDEILKQYRSNPMFQQQLIQQVLEEQAVAWLLERATVKDVTKTFAEVMDIKPS